MSIENQMDKAQSHGAYNRPGAGVKIDQGKPQFHLLPYDLMAGENRVWAKGAIKYDKNNWRKGMPITQGLNAGLRHLFAFAQGEDLDPETTESHLDHAICCIRMMQNTLKYHPSLDDRAKWTKPQTTRMAEDFHDDYPILHPHPQREQSLRDAEIVSTLDLLAKVRPESLRGVVNWDEVDKLRPQQQEQSLRDAELANRLECEEEDRLAAKAARLPTPAEFEAPYNPPIVDPVVYSKQLLPGAEWKYPGMTALEERKAKEEARKLPQMVDGPSFTRFNRSPTMADGS